MIGIQIHTLTRANCGIKNHVDVEISKKEKEGGITLGLGGAVGVGGFQKGPMI
jgi:hypothetical protein